MTKDYKKTYVGNGKYKPSHIVIMENELGRPLQENEVVHHINGNKHDNDPINLTVLTQSEHMAIHRILDGAKFRMDKGNQIRFMYEEMEMNTQDIAEELNVGKTVIGNVIKEMGISRPQVKRKKLSMDDEFEVIKLHGEGLTQKEIAEKFGVSRYPIAQILKGVTK